MKRWHFLVGNLLAAFALVHLDNWSHYDVPHPLWIAEGAAALFSAAAAPLLQPGRAWRSLLLSPLLGALAIGVVGGGVEFLQGPPDENPLLVMLSVPVMVVQMTTGGLPTLAWCALWSWWCTPAAPAEATGAVGLSPAQPT